MNRDLTKGSVVKSMLLFAIPMILGDLLQQCYNIADTLIVGQFLGKTALAAVGSSFTLMTFLTSVILGLCMGSGALFSMRYGQHDEKALSENVCASFVFIALVTALLNILSFAFLDGLRVLLQVPKEVWGSMRSYLFIVFLGIPAIFLYNYFAAYLRALGNSVIPLVFFVPFCWDQYWIGSLVCHWTWKRCFRCCRSHSDFSVSFRYRSFYLYSDTFSKSQVNMEFPLS